MKKIDSLGFLRGVAVLMVCLCHFGNPLANDNIFSGLFTAFHEYGKYGVQVFFVISGFVIPFSLYKGKYVLSDYFKFLYKRLLRLHPPYLVALLLTLVIMFVSYRARHLAFPENASSIIKSLFYLHIPADNPVFWTLAVEAQYYLFIGLFYIALIRYPRISVGILIPILVALGQTSFSEYVTLFSYLIFFLIGIVGFLIYSELGMRLLNWIVLGALIVASFVFDEVPGAIASLAAIAFILLYTKSIPEALQFPGKVSYSVYLIHFPVGVKLINFLSHKVTPSYNWLLLIALTVFVFIVGHFYYKIFEEYSEALSKRIKYKAAMDKEAAAERAKAVLAQ
jgi:peptidoglycan/LPS O-acetylase OafA/YrhL